MPDEDLEALGTLFRETHPKARLRDAMVEIMRLRALENGEGSSEDSES